MTRPVASEPFAEPLRVAVAMLERAFDRHAIVDAVANALVAHAGGRFEQPAPLHLRFDNGDCHVKTGFLRGGETFTVKIATGFHRNADHGLPNAHGMLLLGSQKTGLPLALFEDGGLLTAWRTTAAAIIAARAGAPRGVLRAAIVGAGLQAAQIADWLPHFCQVASVSLWARDPLAGRQVASGLTHVVNVEEDLSTLCRQSNLIFTATPADTPLVRSDWIEPGTHIVALGADTPGKVEIDPGIVARCAVIATDDHAQCLDHGDFGHAVRAGLVSADRDVPLGSIIGGTAVGRHADDDVTMADLTGLAAQDDAIARLFLSRLGLASESGELPEGQRRAG